MFLKILSVVFLLVITIVASEDTNFIYNGFQSSHLYLDGSGALISNNGLLRLTNATKQQKGHVFYPNPIALKNTFNGSLSSFSTTFLFAIRPEYPTLGGNGIAFVLSPTKGLPYSLPNQFLGLFNTTNNGENTNHVFAVELDTILNTELNDINDNHVGIDINDIRSVVATPAGYYGEGKFQNLTLIGGNPMQVWVEYDGVKKQICVFLAPINFGKPQQPLLSLSKDLSPFLDNHMYVGFSSSTGSFHTSHYLLGWSFKVNGQAQDLVISELPKLPKVASKKESNRFLTIGLPLITLSLVFMITLAVIYVIRRKRTFAEVLEDWELEYGPNRFKFKDLYFATKEFREKELLGSGGFGRVYKGVMPKSKIEVAVKRVSHESSQGMRAFVSEIVSIGRLHHRNLVPLLGYCRRKGELLLVYDYMPNGSLDRYLHNQPTMYLNWKQRFTIIKGVASGLLYLHEEWEQVVVHRDIKASNVMLDGEMNARLGDFGLARLYDHGSDPQTTFVVGTLGYLAPEITISGKATTSSDVYGFGAFLLEVACGKRPIEHVGEFESIILVEWVYDCWKRGEILEAKDPNLGTEYNLEEVELVLKLGLLCSHSEPLARPSMRQIVQYLEMDVPLVVDLSSLNLSFTTTTFEQNQGIEDFAMSIASSMVESILSGGR